MSGPFDCQECGACCADGLLVNLTGTDLERIGHPLRNLLLQPPSIFDMVVFGRPPVMRQRAGRCVCLRGEVGKSVQCDIYEIRPDCCREVEPGGEGCLWIRERAGMGVGA